MLDPETGYSKPNLAYGYVAQAVTVEVDTETGHVQVLNVVSANDVGKAINPQQIRGQIEGAVVQAAGYSILENFVQKDGYVQTLFLHLSDPHRPGCPRAGAVAHPWNFLTLTVPGTAVWLRCPSCLSLRR